MQAERVPVEAGPLLFLNDAIDHALERALTRYHEARSKTLAALERIAQEAFASHGKELREFLRRFLAIILDTNEPVDTAVIYLREWDRLVVRAAVGVEASAEDSFSVRLGEDIAGTVAAQRQSYFTSSAATDPLARNAALIESGMGKNPRITTFMIYGDDLIGVAKMGSRTATDFSEDDRQLFSEMAQRASVLIAHRRLAEEREVFSGSSADLRSPLNTITMSAGYLGSERLCPSLRLDPYNVSTYRQRGAWIT